jgi:gliding motility-associated-like protein
MKARDAITYVVKGTNAAGCTDTDTLEVTISATPVIAVPNAFRPGGTSNPVLRPVLRLAKGLSFFQVYNRWGQMVFSTKTVGEGWDGNYKGLPQPSGAYVWMLEAIDGQGNIVRLRGSSILIR